MYKVVRYNRSHRELWNHFLSKSKNGTFLFNRDYLDYHSDRFDDHSLVFFDKSKIVAIFPANQRKKNIYSHEGLTYGGLVFSEETKFLLVLEYFYLLLKYYDNQGFSFVHYRPAPSFYEQYPSSEYEYALYVSRATLVGRDVGFVVDQRNPITWQKQRIRNIRKAQQAGIKAVQSKTFKEFWQDVLSPNLKQKFNKKPVHTLEEIELLAKRFPRNIKQFNALLGKRVVAGATVFENKKCVHVQYNASNDAGRETSAIDLLFSHLLTKVYKKCAYFSFGISTEDHGKVLNRGLTRWKEGFGASAWPSHFYKVSTKNHSRIKRYI